MSKNPNGRPTLYSDKLADKICKAVATSTLGLSKICSLNPDFPCRDTIYEWRYEHKKFSDKYAIAKAQQAELLAEEIMDISDDGINDTYINDDGKVCTDHDVIQRARLRVDSRKWIACKLLPKIYGDKMITETKLTLHETELKDLE